MGKCLMETNPWSQCLRNGNNKFLFEFATRLTAEQIMMGAWDWKKLPVELHWWSPVAGVFDQKANPSSVWMRIVGLGHIIPSRLSEIYVEDGWKQKRKQVFVTT